MNTKELLIEYFKTQPVGHVMSHQQAQEVFKVSEKTIDRIIARAKDLRAAGIEVTRQVSFVKVGGDVPKKDIIVDPQRDNVPGKDNGITISIPEDLLNKALNYRKSAFENAGLDPQDLIDTLKAGVSQTTMAHLALWLVDRFIEVKSQLN